MRHGQTAWNVARRFLGRTDVPLDAVGLDQAARLARRLTNTRLAAVWSSPLARAHQTARRIGEPRLDDGLLEIDMGALEGLSPTEFLAQWPDVARAWRERPHDVALPGGEHLDDVQARGLDAMARIGRTLAPGETVVVVTHQILLASVVCRYQGAPLADFRRFMHRNTGITTVELGDAPTVLGFDDATHLDTPAG